MNDPQCLVCTPALCVHGEQAPTIEEIEIANLRNEVVRLKAERERAIFERSTNLALSEEAVATSLSDQLNDLVGTLQAIAELVGLKGNDAWAALCEDPSLVLRPVAADFLPRGGA
jgi:hypothetical protein